MMLELFLSTHLRVIVLNMIEEKKETSSSLFFVVCSWLVHLLTATSGVLALLGAQAASEKNFRVVLYVLVFTIIIDAIDGPLARLVNVRKHTPQFSGALLDYIVDFVTWVFLPAFCLIQSSFFTETSRFILASMMVLSSCFQFCCEDLKVHRNYFKRWPSAWSIVVICLFTWPVPEIFFFYVIILFSILSFVPIYFAHSLRADVKFTGKKEVDHFLSRVMISSSILFLVALLVSVKFYPDVTPSFFYFEVFCVSLYAILTTIQNIVFYKDQILDK